MTIGIALPGRSVVCRLRPYRVIFFDQLAHNQTTQNKNILPLPGSQISHLPHLRRRVRSAAVFVWNPQIAPLSKVVVVAAAMEIGKFSE